MKAYWQLVWAQLLLFARNRNTIIWSLILPVFMMLALGTQIGDGDNRYSVSIGIVDEDRTAASAEFAGQIRKLEGVRAEAGSGEELVSRLKKGELGLVVKIRKGFAEDLQRGKPGGSESRIVLFLDKSNPTVSEMGTTLVDRVLDRFNKERLGYRPVIRMETENVQARQLTYVDFLVPGILSLMIMSNNLNGVAATIASWRERGILRRMQGTPLTSGTFIAGQMTARVLMGALQAIAVLLVAWGVFGVKVYGSWLLLIALILLGTLTFMSIGFIVASLARTPESAGPIAGLISFPMIFVGGIFFPVRDLPELLQPLVKAIPIGYLTDALRGVMNQGAGLTELMLPSAVLLAWALGAFLVASLTFRWDVK
jgi:ABC-2 type transport system permease protein